MNVNQHKLVSKNRFIQKPDMIVTTFTICLIRENLRQNNNDQHSKLKLIRSYNKIVTRMKMDGSRN